jgi:hypothetical protein
MWSFRAVSVVDGRCIDPFGMRRITVRLACVDGRSYWVRDRIQDRIAHISVRHRRPGLRTEGSPQLCEVHDGPVVRHVRGSSLVRHDRLNKPGAM